MMEGIVDFLFPRTCVGCGMFGYGFWCFVCADRVAQLPQPLPRTVDGFFVCAAYPFASPEVSSAVHALKYRSMYAAAQVCAEWVRASCIEKTAMNVGVVLIPVPLHARRFVERGFNQTELIARAVSCVYPDMTVLGALVRTRYAHPQAKSDREDRREQMRGAFELAQGITLCLETQYIVVDDVLTTGATLGECMRTLVSSGASAEKVSGVVVASA